MNTLTQQLSIHDLSPVRFIFSSLEPSFGADGKLLEKSRSGSKIRFFSVKSAQDLGVSQFQKLVLESKFASVCRLIPPPFLQQAICFILCMTGGHWATICAVMGQLRKSIPIFDRLHPTTIGDTVVATLRKFFATPYGSSDTSFGQLLKHSIFAEKVLPTSKIEGKSVAELIQDLSQQYLCLR
jgi:hypothetical protein